MPRLDSMQICGVFGVMMVPYFFSTWWGYHCQPFWGAAVLTAYYGCAMVGLTVAAFAKSVSARCARCSFCMRVRTQCNSAVCDWADHNQQC